MQHGAIAERYGESAWFDPQFQAGIIHTIERVARGANLDFTTGPEGFAWLAPQ
jgi:hypothetical protein